MINQTDPQAAFPDEYQNGMTLRDYFAAKAMQGLISEPSIQGTMDEFAHRAYAIADAMLTVRETK